MYNDVNYKNMLGVFCLMNKNSIAIVKPALTFFKGYSSGS